MNQKPVPSRPGWRSSSEGGSEGGSKGGSSKGGSNEGGSSEGEGPCSPLRFSIIITVLLGGNSRSVRKSSMASDRRSSRESSA